MISYEESMQRLYELDVRVKETVTLPLMESIGYVIAKDIVANYNSPEASTAAMDGFAIKAADQVLEKLKIQAINPAGANEVPALIAGKAIKTFTGSLMPEGSDTLIPIENVEEKDGYIIIKKSVAQGFSVREVGENFKKGEVLIQQGTIIDFAQIGVMASLNITEVEVYDKPKVAIIATGEELLELGQEQTKPTQIRSSNNYTIEALVKKYGATPLQFGCVGDDIHKLKEVFTIALEQSDIVVSTGGVSVGDFDFVKDIVKEHLGADVIFKGVVIKPGQHIMLAKKKQKIILALPGFAYSSTVTALLYLVPLIFKMQGVEYKHNIINATLLSNYKKKSLKTEFAPCNISLVNGEFCIDFIGKKSGTSAIMTNMLGNSALAMTKPDEGDKKMGEKMKVLIYDCNFKKGGANE